MLFLLNDHIVELEAPETHLRQRWRAMGCGDPYRMRAQEAIEFVREAVTQITRNGGQLQQEQIRDFASLIVAKTGANALILKPRADGALEPRLQDVPLLVLEAYQRGAANDSPRKPARAPA